MRVVNNQVVMGKALPTYYGFITSDCSVPSVPTEMVPAVPRHRARDLEELSYRSTHRLHKGASYLKLYLMVRTVQSINNSDR